MKKGKKWTVESVIDEYLENAKPGGLILDIKKLDENDQKKVMESAAKRIKRSSKQTIDLIEKNDNELISIVRIKIGDE